MEMGPACHWLGKKAKAAAEQRRPGKLVAGTGGELWPFSVCIQKEKM
jgi:hypothetical protein